jgi:hypothetical protein
MSFQARRAPRRLGIAAGLAVAALVGGTVASALPASPAGQWAGGSVRLSSNFETDSISITGTSGPDSLKRVVRSKIVVPSGKVADVQATFSGTIFPYKTGTYAYCFARFTVDSQTNADPAFRPGQIQLLGGTSAEMPDQFSVAAAAFRRNIGAGQHYINVYISSAYAGCSFQERTLNLVVNIR